MVNIDKIKRLAKEKGISITHICNTISQGPYYLNDVKKRCGDIPDDRLQIIADILGTTLECLRDESDIVENKKPPADNDEEPDKNTVIIRGRDGSYSRRHLTDDQIKMLQAMLDSLPDAPDDL